MQKISFPYKYANMGSFVFLMSGSFILVFLVSFLHSYFANQYPITESSRLLWLLLWVFIQLTLAFILGFPHRVQPNQQWLSAILVTFFSVVAIALLQLTLADQLLPRFVLFISPPFLVLTLVASAKFSGTRDVSQYGNTELALITSPKEFDTIKADLLSAKLAFNSKYFESMPTSLDTLLKDFVRSGNEKKLIVIDESLINASLDPFFILDMYRRGIQIRRITDFYNDYVGKLPIRHLKVELLLFDIRELHQNWYPRVSRLLDFLVGLLLAPFIIILVPFIWIGNLIGNQGPLLFTQPRTGKDGSEFVIYKFRTMKPGSQGSEWTRANDSRITKFGYFLRVSHLDETPQILNILRGDLSFVGPRPEQPVYVAQLNESIPFYALRHVVRPGLSGWAQVNYPYGADENDAFEKLQYDLWYLKNQSLLLDLRILLLTFFQLTGLKGR